MKAEIVKLVSLLMSSLPSRLPSGMDIKLALEGYVIALDDCDLVDLETAVKRCIKGQPIAYKWAPSASELAQLVRDARARRLHPKTTEALSPPDPEVSDEQRKNAVARWEKIRKEFGRQLEHKEWVKANIEAGIITKAE